MKISKLLKIGRRLLRSSLKFPTSLLYIWVVVLFLAAVPSKCEEKATHVVNKHFEVAYINNSTLSTELFTASSDDSSTTAPAPAAAPQPPQPVSLGLPASQTGFKSWMPKYTLSCYDSDEHRLKKYYTTDEHGLCCVNSYYCVAVGTYYSSTVGDLFHITLSSGRAFDIIVADIKDNKDTDTNHQYTRANGCMTEFIVNTASDGWYDNRARITGDISSDGFAGIITSIVKTGHYNF